VTGYSRVMRQTWANFQNIIDDFSRISEIFISVAKTVKIFLFKLSKFTAVHPHRQKTNKQKCNNFQKIISQEKPIKT
jgi:hypothetical protein